MIEFTPFHASHLRYLTPQPTQRHDHAILLSSDYAQEMENHFALSAWDGVKCVGAAGCIPIYSHRAVAWAVLASEASMHMLAITRKVRSAIKMLPYRRIEIAVQVDFDAGHRFAKLIGMKLETPEPLKAHGATGKDEMLYAVVK